MGLFDFLVNDEKEEGDNKLTYETGKALGMSDEEIEDAINSGISPEEWLEENDYDNFLDQELDKE